MCYDGSGLVFFGLEGKSFNCKQLEMEDLWEKNWIEGFFMSFSINFKGYDIFQLIQLGEFSGMKGVL